MTKSSRGISAMPGQQGIVVVCLSSWRWIDMRMNPRIGIYLRMPGLGNVAGALQLGA